MKKNILRLPVAGLLAVAMVLAPVAGIAQDKPKTPAAPSAEGKPAPAQRAIPFNGKVGAIDPSAKTVTVGERVFQITAETKITKGNKPATLADGAVGEVVAGNYLKGDDGKLTAKMIRFGPKPPESEPAAKKEKKSTAAE